MGSMLPYMAYMDPSWVRDTQNIFMALLRGKSTGNIFPCVESPKFHGSCHVSHVKNDTCSHPHGLGTERFRAQPAASCEQQAGPSPASLSSHI